MRPQFNLRVLLVEDNLVNQKVGKLLLERFGCDVATAENGAEALDLLKDEFFPLIVMDCQMPVVDGYETSRRIRELEAAGRPRAIILALTAHAMQGDREKCMEAGMDDYLAKPINLSSLETMLVAHLQPQPKAAD